MLESDPRLPGADPNARPDWWPADQPWPPPSSTAGGPGTTPITVPPGASYGGGSTTPPPTGTPPPGWTPQYAPGATPAPAGTTAGTGGPGTINAGGSLIAPFNQPFAPPTPTPLPNAPTVPQIPGFVAPTLAEAMNDPGYQFSYNQGADQLKNWLAAHGTFNDSSGAQSLINYGQNAAETQYNNVWSRGLNAYNTNTQTQFLDPFNQAFQNYSTTAPLVQHGNDIDWQNAFNAWNQNWNIFKDQRDSTFDKQFKVATA